MHASAILLLVAISVGCTYAIVCPPTICETLKCVDEVEANGECLVGTVKMPTFCGCCTRCVVPIEEGKRCSMAIGVPQHPCEDGHACIGGVCKRIH